MASEAYEAVIGLEVHAHLQTASKLFCGCATKFGAPPNDNVCPVCMGMPGVLPVLNWRAVELAIRMGLAAYCEISEFSLFARKSYFYPDLPKGYQISQYELPICNRGYVEIPGNGDGAPRRVRLVRIHLEEDAGKNIHGRDASLIDFNRSGVPLAEIVSEPDLRSAADAVAYLHELRALLVYVGASDGRLEEGGFRCDCNVSVRPRGASEFGVKTEIKNLNSLRFVEKAINFEIKRQIEILESGGRIMQETHLFDPEREETRPMRSKEFANDYRYFPEPDLPPLRVPPAMVEEIRATMPVLPAELRKQFKDYGLTDYEIGVLLEEPAFTTYFIALLDCGLKNRKATANWVMTEVLRVVNETGKPIAEAVPTAAETGALLKMVEEAKISLNAAKTAFSAMVKSGKSATATIEELGLAQVSDASAIAAACDAILAAEPDKVAEFRSGRDKLFGFFVGQVMKAMGGKANPKVINEILRRKLQG
jgi:aspartyl-tRNA(Asn)/glutamyl-tRNA(Gln) amidotransferase subunit B